MPGPTGGGGEGEGPTAATASEPLPPTASPAAVRAVVDGLDVASIMGHLKGGALRVRDHSTSVFHKRRRCFRGCDVVACLATDLKLSAECAEEAARRLLDQGHIGPAAGDGGGGFKSDETLYRFRSGRATGSNPSSRHGSVSSVDRAALSGGGDAQQQDVMASPGTTNDNNSNNNNGGSNGSGGGDAPTISPEVWNIVRELRRSVKIKDRTYHFRKYKRCFIGQEAVCFLVQEGYAADNAAAVDLGNQLLCAGFFAHVVDPDHDFENDYLFYRWKDDCIPNLLTSTSGSERASFQDSMLQRNVSQFLAPPPMSSPAPLGPISHEFDRLCDLEETLHAIKVEQRVIGSVVVILLLPQVLGLGGLVWKALVLAAVLGTCLVLAQASRVQASDFWALFASAAPSRPRGSEANPDEDEEATDLLLHTETSRLQRMRAALEAEFPESAEAFTDHYLNEVMSAPSKKNPSKCRTFSYSRDKLLKALAWQRENRVAELTAEGLGEAVTCASLYWLGYDCELRPVLWVHPQRKDWSKLDLDEEIRLHALMIQEGISFMPPGVSQFTIIADANGMGLSQANPSFAKALLKMVTVAYPDRLGALYAGPINIVIRGLYRAIHPFMPKRLTAKIKLTGDPGKDIGRLLGEAAVPAHFGGPAEHPASPLDVGAMARNQLALLSALGSGAEADGDGAPTSPQQPQAGTGQPDPHEQHEVAL